MESIAADLSTMVRTPLHEAHVEAMWRIGEEQRFSAGTLILREGDRMTHFLYLVDGEAEAIDPHGERWGTATIGPTQFCGEICFLNDSALVLSQRAVSDCRFLAVPRQAMLELMAQIPEMGDIIVTVFSARRRGLIEHPPSSLTFVGPDQDRRIGQLAAFASRNRIPFRILDLESPEAAQIAAQRGADEPLKPAVVLGERRIIEPTAQALAKAIGIDMDLDADVLYDVIIVGAGPAGIAAAVYAGAEGLRGLVLEDATIGGQAGTSSRIENYMGFPTGISGADLCWRGEVQAMRLGTQFAMPRRVTHLERRDDGTFCVELQDGSEVCAKAVVIATGVQYRRLAVDRLAEFEGAGVYYAATDLEARRCSERDVIVIGGGNSAGQAAMFLCRSSRHVHVLVRGPSLATSMSAYLSERLLHDPSITVHFCHELEALRGESRVQAATLRDNTTEERWSLDVRAVFVMVGAAPNTGWLAESATVDDRGFVCTGPDVGGRSPYETSVPGLFAVGDVRAGSTKRVASGVGEGSVVISSVWSHVQDLA